MSFIKVCPEHAKAVTFYSTEKQWKHEVDAEAVKKGVPFCIPLHFVKDGKEMSATPQKIVFDRVGEYKVRTFIHSDANEFASFWEYDTKQFCLRSYSVRWESFPGEKISICNERVCIFAPNQEVQVAMRPVTVNEYWAILVTIEHLDT